MTFESVISLLDSWVGTEVAVTLSASPHSPTTSGVTIRGSLGAVTCDNTAVISPAPGRRYRFPLGTQGQLLLHEGDFRSAELESAIAGLLIDLSDLQINVVQLAPSGRQPVGG